MNLEDHIQRRIVVEYGSLYVYLYMADASGKVLDDESFKQPFRLSKRDIADETKDCYDSIWEWLNETVNVTPLQDSGGDASD